MSADGKIDPEMTEGSLYVAGIELRLTREAVKQILEKLPDRTSGVLVHDKKGVPFIVISAIISIEQIDAALEVDVARPVKKEDWQ